MCGVFCFSKRESCIIIGACVIFSPLLAVGAIGYGGCVGASMGIKKVKSAADKSQHKSAVKKAKSSLQQQRNRAMKALGGAEYQRQLQSLYEATQSTPSFASYFQFAMALFMNEDYVTANDAMETAISLAKDSTTVCARELGEAMYLQGIMLEHLGLYAESARMFDAAAEQYITLGEDAFVDVRTAHDGVTQVPSVTLTDIYNAQGFTRYLLATEGRRVEMDEDSDDDDDVDVEKNESRVREMTAAIDCFTRAIRATKIQRPSYYHNRGMAYQVLGGMVKSPLSSTYLENAVQDFDIALNDENHDTPAISLILKAKCLSLLDRLPEAYPCSTKAFQIDPKIPHMDITSRSQCKAPHPLPQVFAKISDCYAPHSWRERRFHRPSWCDHCMKVITFKESVVKGQAAECTKCKMRVHHECRANLEGTVCWEDVKEPIEVGDTVFLRKSQYFGIVSGDQGIVTAVDACRVFVSLEKSRRLVGLLVSEVILQKKGNREDGGVKRSMNHTHRFKQRPLHRPHWCDLCKKWISSFKGLMCSDCGILIHQDCLPSNAIVVDN
eukprot:PhF_6_TR42136/c0_g1_i1/m.63646